MSAQVITMYGINCDKCKMLFEEADEWDNIKDSPAKVRQEAAGWGWSYVDDNHDYCPKCTPGPDRK